ncbi:MAG: MBL fold metallo-hydrolase [Chitinophagaceae bacterium]|nr:MBL fold metallo-hydrolase [Chitinophagaceae bacterium]
MQDIPHITADTLSQMLSLHKPVNVIDIRPVKEREEWFIPGSIHIDAYNRLKQNDDSVFNNIHLDKTIPVVTVCAGGKTSLIATDMLQLKGYNAFSLQDGMKGWSLAWNTAYRYYDDFELWQIRRTGKGCLSYIIASNKEAIIIDASLPVEVYAQLAKQHQLSIKYIIETHIHADHLSRSKELAEYFNAPLYLPAPNKIQFEFHPIKADTVFSVGSVVLQSMPTPGHTLESYSFYIENKILITGDTLFANGVGRPDLKSSEEESRKKAKLLYQSLQSLLSLPDDVVILPAHTSKPIEFDNKLVQTTIGEAKKNIAMLKTNEEDFVNSLLQKIPPAPPNFLAIAEKNIIGSYEGINPVDLEAGANRCAVS